MPTLILGDHQLIFGVLQLTFGVLQLTFGVLQSAFGVLQSAGFSTNMLSLTGQKHGHSSVAYLIATE
ncbi:MAG: hypothetical protein LBF88_09415 [Planctomycetaceae bacterium]|nr:hypothetical protein [Planctomycetaceae bacterium]